MKNKFRNVIINHSLFGNKNSSWGECDKYQKIIEGLLVYIALIGEFLSIF